MSTPRRRFLDLLRRDILELDGAELDFGIYRVPNHRRATVQHFLAAELPARIVAALARLSGQAGEGEEARIAADHLMNPLRAALRAPATP